MPYPNQELAIAYGFNPRVVHSYNGQLYLRKQLNQIHQHLYDPNTENKQPHVPKVNMVSYLEDILDAKKFVPPGFEFSPQEPPANEILMARLRAKFWGARVITYRPFVKQILDFNSDKAEGGTVSPAYGHDQSGFNGPTIGPDVKHENDIDPQILEYAAKGIHALIESTRAFHGLDDKRFIITNVFGTAHA